MATIWAKILNGLVVNIQMAADSDQKDPDFVWVDLGSNPNGVDIGWSYDGTNLIAPQQ